MEEHPIDADLREDVRDLLSKGEKIQAIKLIVQNSELGLKQAKDYVEDLERRMR